jgi:hypothetical protein
MLSSGEGLDSLPACSARFHRRDDPILVQISSSNICQTRCTNHLGRPDAAFTAGTEHPCMTVRHRDGVRRRASGLAAPLLELLGPPIDFALGRILGVAVTFLKQAEQFVALAFDGLKIVVRQLAPLRPDLAFGCFQFPSTSS